MGKTSFMYTCAWVAVGLVALLFILCAFSSVNKRTTVVLNSPLQYVPDNANDWDKMSNQLETARNTNFVFYWKGAGGVVLQGDDFIHAVKVAQEHGNKVTFVITGEAASMHAFTPCYGDKVEITQFGVLYFHSIRTEVKGNQGRAGLDQETQVQQDTMLAQCKKKGFITQAQIDDVNNAQSVRVYMKDGKRVSYTGKDE